MYQSVFRTALFAGQVVVVTGGGSGIGRCVAHELASLGATVALVGRNQDKLAAVQAELQQAGIPEARVSRHRADIRDEAAVKALVAEVDNAQMNIEWLDIPVVEKSRYRLKTLPDNTMGFQSQGFTFAAGQDFDGERLTNFFNDLPKMTEGLVRAKGVFQVLGTWVWLNWVDGQWGASQVSWRRDSRFELIAKSFDADLIEKKLTEALE